MEIIILLAFFSGARDIQHIFEDNLNQWCTVDYLVRIITMYVPILIEDCVDVSNYDKKIDQSR
ncbi:hypothetical protein JHJ32_13820 [Parapedobacter sp. ISTM3]|uniref:hypothetical protein n=1 Tax=Parapedobacter TaxID=416949 RepID=UPI0011162431|nr:MULTISPECIES: hypothetical protein [Parapedobacter]MBK1441073.1 hypothetical protein [Parapedobacter sp. ISTM3]